MESRKSSSTEFDAVILGASGFTGKYVLREFLQCMQDDGRLKLALAGRSVAKLEAALRWATDGSVRQQRVSVVAADATDAASLRRLCGSTRVLLNCVGPCNQYGEAIVGACVEAGADYVDISGEAEFMERMEAKYQDAAVAAKVVLVSACASVSIVSDIGLQHHLRSWPHSVAPPPSSVFSYVRIHSFASNHVASAETGFLALANAAALARFRRSLPRRPPLQIPGPPPAVELDTCLHYERKLGYWAGALPICDRSVVRRTFWTLHGHPRGLPTLQPEALPDEPNAFTNIRPVHFRQFLAIQTLRWAIIFFWATQILKTLSRYTLGLKLLLKYPQVFTVGAFTHRGPTEKEVAEGSFEMWFVGKGYQKDGDTGDLKVTEVVTKVKGPESCYITSAIGIVQCAMLCLHSRHILPVGGVLTTASAFGGANIQGLLEARGLSFEHVSTSINATNGPQYENSIFTLKPWVAYSLPIIFLITILIFFVFLLFISFS